MSTDSDSVPFCADQFVTDAQRNWNRSSPLPIPTECMSHTLLIGIPCAVFWFFLPVLLIQCRNSENSALKRSKLSIVKWWLTVILIFSKLSVISVTLYQDFFSSQIVPYVQWIYPVVVFFTLCGLLVMQSECQLHGITSSGVIFCTWLCLSIFGIPEYYAWWNKQWSELESYYEIANYYDFAIYYPVVILMTLLLCFADPLTLFSKSGRECPEASASFLNKQLFYWFGSLVSVGHKKPLEVDDVFELDEDLDASTLAAKWKEPWHKSLESYHKKKQCQKAEYEKNKEKMPLLKNGNRKEAPADGATTTEMPKMKAVPNPSILLILWKLFKWEFIGANIIKFFSDMLQFALPGFLSLLISFTEDVDAPWWLGVAYAIGLFVTSILRSILLNDFFHIMIKLGAKIQTTLTTAVYDKTLQLSNSARRQKTQGEIVNLMSIDVERFKLITPQVPQFWSSPLQMTVCIFLLWRTIGSSVFAGLFVMIAVIPINFVVAKRTKGWQAQQMKRKDERIKLTNEVLSGIKVIKLYGWEPALEDAIDAIRVEEMKLIRKSAILKTCSDMINFSSPFLVALATFTTFTLSSSENVLTPQIAFVSLTLFNTLRMPMFILADLISQTQQANVANKRLKEFLVCDELDETTIDRSEKGHDQDKAVEVDNCTLTWDREATPTLNDVILKVPKKSLLAVVGTVGSGKSSLISALLGEMDKLRGYIGVRGSAAFVPQQPWIQNRTLRDNILMEKPFDRKLYDEIVEACALKQDLDLFPHGDQTEIGEKGINLSGGQKARIALARAVYQDRDLYLLDDPLSAVDAHVAKHIFEKVIGPNGLLAKKTRILVTHSLSFLKDTSCIAVMKNGTITHMDTYQTLLKDKEIAEFLKEVEVKKQEEVRRSVSLTPSTAIEPLSLSDLESSDDDEAAEPSVRSARKMAKIQRQMSKDPSMKKLIVQETSETGRVDPRVYLDYFKAMGLFTFFIPFVLAMMLQSIVVMMRSFWLTHWSDDHAAAAVETEPKYSLGTRLGVYAVLGFTEVFFLAAAFILNILGGVSASLKLHRPLLHNILRSPLSFFDVTPLGRIINRLGKDMDVIDQWLAANLRFLVVAFFSVSQTVVVICISTPLFILMIIPIIIVYMLILNYFIKTSRQLSRLASSLRSPIYSHFGETIQGAATIRAFGWQEQFRQQNKTKIEEHIRCSYYAMTSNRWLTIRLEMVGNIIILVTALLAVMSKDWGTVTAGVIGLSVSYSFNITFMMNLFVRQVSEVETNVVAVERVREYSHTTTEAPWTSNRALPVGWPHKGKLTIKDYSTRYRPGLDLVLKGLSLNVNPGEKIGVVGRTGAGKSSLALALFRIVEPADGQIILDDVDIATIGLHDLRWNLTIIPQDPVLFSGSLRFNLDPTARYSDADLWKALENANLKEFVEKLPKKLEHSVDEDGVNISVGQRQLVCLTRALLKKSRVLILDEATASVDAQTDALIQSTIRKEFANSTVITVAHRLNTIMDYDKILVMDQGSVAEFDPPKVLLSRRTSIFYSMAQSAKLV